MHVVFVPLIVWTAMVMLLPFGTIFTLPVRGGIAVDVALLFTVIYSLYYLTFALKHMFPVVRPARDAAVVPVQPSPLRHARRLAVSAALGPLTADVSTPRAPRS